MNIPIKKITFIAASLTIAASVGMDAHAATTVGFSNITPSTSLPAEGGYPLSEIVDGVTGSIANGFVSNNVGVITFTFDQDYDLSSFILWNDVNVNAEGIDDFQLRFYDSTNSQITVPFSTDYVGPLGQVAPEEYVFISGVSNVRRVDLEVLTTQFNFAGPVPRIEIREVDFGVVPEPSSILLLGVSSIAFMLRHSRK